MRPEGEVCIGEMMREHKALHPEYAGSPAAPLPTHPEREDGQGWDAWGPQLQERTLRRKIGDDLFEALGEMEKTQGGIMASDLVLNIFDELKALHEKKDADYAGEEALSNFKRCERFGVPAWKGCLVRMSDKWSRLVNVVGNDGDHAVEGESVVDTLKDLAVYSVITLALLEGTPGWHYPGEVPEPEKTPYDYMKRKTDRAVYDGAGRIRKGATAEAGP